MVSAELASFRPIIRLTADFRISAKEPAYSASNMGTIYPPLRKTLIESKGVLK